MKKPKRSKPKVRRAKAHRRKARKPKPPKAQPRIQVFESGSALPADCLDDDCPVCQAIRRGELGAGAQHIVVDLRGRI